ncbi:MAG: glycosyltransferase family 4 protein [Thermoplasmata archaeon]
MRVVLVGGGVEPIPPTGYGGTERFIADLSDALRSAGHETVVVNRVRGRRLRDEYPFAWELPRLLRQQRYDVVHANSPVVANRLAWLHVPYAYTTHSRHWYYRDRITHRWGYWLERRAVRHSGAAVALTEPLARTIAAAVVRPRRPIRVIPFGVDGEVYRPDWSRREGGVALGVGVVAPVKRWELAAEALRGTGLRLVLVGPTPDSNYAQRVRAAGNHVELTGEISRDALAARYAESDLLLHPSRVELLSGTVVQALSAGLPVVGGPALTGVVEDGRTGFVVPDADAPSFVVGMRARSLELARDAVLRRRLGDSARAVAQERFSWPRVVQQYVELYRELSTSPPPD